MDSRQQEYIKQFLSQVDILSSQSQLGLVARYSKMKVYSLSNVLYREDSPVQHVYFIIEG